MLLEILLGSYCFYRSFTKEEMAGRSLLHLLGLDSMPSRETLKNLFIVFVSCLAGNIIAAISGRETPVQNAIIDSYLPKRGPYKWFAIFDIGVVSPIREELIYRGWLSLILSKYRLSWECKLFLSALIFAFDHRGYAYPHILSSFFMGGFASWQYMRSGTLYAPMFMHMTNNILRSCAELWK